MPQMINMLNLQRSIAEWAGEKFPDRSIMGAVNKLVLEEIPELVKELPNLDGDFAGELGDCFILLLDIADMLGIDAGKATLEKLDELRARSWEQNPLTGFYKHSKE
jgi:NTP pyrophosphatase (non-canonical NTP hydrolase)